MKSRILSLMILLSAFVMPVAYAETSEDLENESVFTQQELDQILAPIALYPDALLSQILMAATYPAEVMEAARWSRQHPDLSGEAAVDATEGEEWDPSVISLTAFPQILAEMEARPEWVEQLGDAFLIQQAQVMDTVQHLRRQALAAGNLQSNDQIVVLQQGQTIVIEQAAPQVVYVPYYNPTVVYGPWWWDAYPPVYWDPWPGYYSSFGPGYYWGSGINVGLGFFYSNFDWHRHHVNIHRHHHRYLKHRQDSEHRHNRQRWTGPNTVHNQPQQWSHDSTHRRNVPYSIPALQQKSAGNSGPPRNARDVLRPDKGSPAAPTRQQARQESVTTPLTTQGGVVGTNQNRATEGAPPNAEPRRQIIPRSTVVMPGGNNTGTIPGRVEVPQPGDHRLARPNISPQTRALAPRSQNPTILPRQTMSQPQPMHRSESAPARPSARAVDRQPQAMPNIRSRQLPQQSTPAIRQGPNAQPRSPGHNPSRMSGNPLKGNHGQSGGGGQYRR